MEHNKNMRTVSASILSSPSWRLRPSAQRPVPVLAAGQVHEVHGQGDDRAAGLAFALGLGAADRDGPVLVVRAGLRQPLALYGEGVAALGIDPARLVLAQARDAAALLRAGLEGRAAPAWRWSCWKAKGRSRAMTSPPAAASCWRPNARRHRWSCCAMPPGHKPARRTRAGRFPARHRNPWKPRPARKSARRACPHWR
jgi:hypothetical protein